MPTNSDFKQLLLKIISDDISLEERVSFYDMVLTENQEEELKTTLKELGEEREELYAGYEFKSEEWEQMKRGILTGNVLDGKPVAKINSVNSNAEKAVLLNDRTIPATLVRKMPVRNLSWITGAAASVVLLVSLAVYLKYYTKLKNEIAVSKKVTNTDIAPGSNKAILTLSNGLKMILDSAHTGFLATQSKADIMKNDNGSIVYKKSKNSNPQGTVEYNTLTTPRGGIYQLVLPDGTHVWLNAASSITYPTAFTAKARTVTISGEAYFEVKHNAAIPFEVQVGKTTVQDIGTAFNINAYPEKETIKTTLVEGLVSVSSNGRGVNLKPSQQASTNVVNQTVSVESNVNLDKVMAWRNGRIAITDVTVQQLMTEISRWYDIDIEFAGAIPNKQFYGSLRRDVPLSTVLHALDAYGVKTTIEGKKIIVQ